MLYEGFEAPPVTASLSTHPSPLQDVGQVIPSFTPQISKMFHKQQLCPDFLKASNNDYV